MLPELSRCRSLRRAVGVFLGWCRTDAESGHATILRRRSEPVAAVIGYAELQRLQALERDLVDVALVLARSATDTGRRAGLDEVIESFGYNRGQLAAMEDPQ